MTSETSLRLLLDTIMRRTVSVDLPIDDLLDSLHEHVQLLERAWLQCHAAHVERQGPLDEVDPGHYARVQGLCWAAASFSTVEDYELAIELALRAFYEGCYQHRATALDVTADPEEVIGEPDAAHALTGGRGESHTT